MGDETRAGGNDILEAFDEFLRGTLVRGNGSIVALGKASVDIEFQSCFNSKAVCPPRLRDFGFLPQFKLSILTKAPQAL